MRKPRRVGEPAPIQELLPSILRGIKGVPGGPMDRLRQAWRETVGAESASRTRLAAFSNGQLRVEVASAALKHDLVAFRAADVIKGLRDRLPDMGIREISYRVAALR